MKRINIKQILCVSAFIFSINIYSQDTRVWATYSGGAGLDGAEACLAKDNLGNIYLCGQTNSPSGISWGGFQNAFGGGTYDAYLAKYNSLGILIWATYYGGAGVEDGNAVITDALGNVYLVGSTNSASGIASNGFQNLPGGNTDGFIVKFDAAGNRLWSSYYGGAAFDEITSVATDISGNVFFGGSTMSTSGISFNGMQNTIGGGDFGDGFLVKFNNAGTRQWATYLGGASDEKAGTIAIDGFGDIYFSGSTLSTNFPINFAYQGLLAGGEDAFLAKYNTNGSILWATYYGGILLDAATSVCVDVFNNVYLAGTTYSSAGISFNGYQNTLNGTNDAMLVKFNSIGNRLWATYFGGTSSEGSGYVATDNLGNVLLISQTSSSSGISYNGFQNTFNGFTDAFLVKFDSAGNRFCSTNYGGISSEYAYGIVTDVTGNIYVAGSTKSTSNIASGGFQNTYGGGTSDQFIVKFTSCSLANSSPDAIVNENDILIYPSPSNGLFLVNTKKNARTDELCVFNLLGEKLTNKKITAMSDFIDLSEYPNGIYFVKLKLNDKIITKKIIKE